LARGPRLLLSSTKRRSRFDSGPSVVRWAPPSSDCPVQALDGEPGQQGDHRRLGVNRSEKVELLRKTEHWYALLQIQLPNVSRSISVPSSDMGRGTEKLGQGTRKAGPLGVLRVLISYSAGFHKDALTSNAGKAPGPIVTADLAQLVEPPLGSGTQTTLARAEEEKP